MPTSKTSRVTVELETGADPIRGSIQRSNGRKQRFWGWLELIASIERAAADQPERKPCQARRNLRSRPSLGCELGEGNQIQT
jgi:hypothetical protein